MTAPPGSLGVKSTPRIDSGTSALTEHGAPVSEGLCEQNDLVFDAEYFAKLKAKQTKYISMVQEIEFEGYSTVEQAAIQALTKKWAKSQMEGVEYGGVIYKRMRDNREIFGFGPAETLSIGIAVQINWKMPPGVEGYLAGLYHTHVRVDLLIGSPEKLSDHDVKMAKKIGGPVYVGIPSGAVKLFSPQEGEKTVGSIVRLPTPEHLICDDDPSWELIRLHSENVKWFRSQLP